MPESASVEIDPRLLDSPESIIEFCKQNNFFTNDVLNLESFIDAHPSLRLAFEPLGANDAYIKKIGDEQFLIVVNSEHPRTRQRFSMAHELAHYFLHRDKIAQMPEGERILHRNDERNSIEYQANDFAANLLMPESTYRQLIQSTSGNVAQMSSRLGLSTLAIRFRALNLGIDGHGL